MIKQELPGVSSLSLQQNASSLDIKFDEDPSPAFICPITSDVFKDPVIAEDGHTYERAAITDWLLKNPLSPLSRIEMKVENLKPNLIVKAMMAEFYKFQSEAKALKNSNTEFSNQFNAEINKLPKENLIDNEYNKILSHLNVEAFICPLTKKIFDNPVVAADGYTYEKEALQNWFVKNDTSPVTKQKISTKSFLSNHATKSMIDLFKQEEKGWQNLKAIDRKFVYTFAPKVREMLDLQSKSLEKKAAQSLLTNWEEGINIHQEKERIIKKQVQLSAYSLKDDKYKFQIPQTTIAFVGRQKELELIDIILEKQNIVCLVGLGGMGKTQLAIEYIRKAQYPAVIWLHGQNQMLTYQIQTYLHKAHNLDLKNTKSLGELLQQFYSSLGPKSLVIIDNVESEEFIQDFLPKRGSNKVIITSRFKSWKLPRVQLQEFSENDLLKYATDSLKDSGRPILPEDLKSLGQLLGGIPLALSQAIACIKQDKNLSIQGYCNTFKKAQSQAFEKDSDEALNNIYTALILSLHDVKKANSHVDLLLDVIGYIAPEQLDKHLCISFLESRDPKGFSKAKDKKIRQGFKTLCDYSIISQHQRNENFYSINRLAQAVIRMIHKKNGSLQKNYSRLADWLLRSIFYNEKDLEDVARVNQMIPHCLAVGSIEDTQFYINKDLLLRQTGYHQFYAMRNYLQAKTCFESALQFSQENHKADKDTLVQILNDLGCVNSQLGDYHNQLKLQEKALSISQKFIGPHSERTAHVLNNLGTVYGHLGEYKKQKQTLQRALNIKEKYLKLEKDDIGISSTLLHLGTAYGNLGDHKKKKEVLQRALAINEKFYGKNHPANNVVRMNLGNAKRQLGENKESIEYLQKALEGAEKRFGKNHPDYALAAMNLATAYDDQQGCQRAIELLHQSLEINERHFGPNNPKTALVLVNLSSFYATMGDKIKAKEFGDRAYKIMFDTYGPHHPETQKILANLEFKNSIQALADFASDFRQSLNEQQKKKLATDFTFLQDKSQKFFEALAPEKKVEILSFQLKESKKKSQKQNIEQCNILLALGRNYFQMKKYNQALTKLTQALQMNEKLQRHQHESQGQILTQIGNSYNQLDQYGKALQILSRALSIHEKQVGKNHHLTAITLTNLGCAYSGLGDQIKNKEVTERAYSIFLKKFGPQHQWTQDALFNLQLVQKKLMRLHQQPAIKQSKSNEDKDAKNMEFIFYLYSKYGQDFVSKHGMEKTTNLDMSEFSVNHDINQYGINHPETLKSLIELGQDYRQLGYPDKAQQNLKRALEVSETIHGKNHAFTTILRQSLVKTKEKRVIYEENLKLTLSLYTRYGENFINFYGLDHAFMIDMQEFQKLKTSKK